MENLANKHQCSCAQLALAWVLHQRDDVVPIPGHLQKPHPKIVDIAFSVFINPKLPFINNSSNSHLLIHCTDQRMTLLGTLLC
jgi:hypothetical protein